MTSSIEASDSFVARRFLQARKRFACEPKTNMNAGRLLRAASDAQGADLIGDEEFEGVLFDVIDYLEARGLLT